MGSFILYMQLIILFGLLIGFIALISITFRNIKERESIWQLLRSLGFTKTKIRFLIFLETIFISFFALIFSIPVALGFNFLFISNNPMFIGIPFDFALQEIMLFFIGMMSISIFIAGLVYLLLKYDTLNNDEIRIDTQR